MASIFKPIHTIAFADWQKMWLDYGSSRPDLLKEDFNRALFERFASPDSGLHGLAAVDVQVLGFSHFFCHPSTWSARPVCQLHDLYVNPISRGQGLGRALIEETANAARDRGCSMLYWRTREANTGAQALYSQIARRLDFVSYQMDL